MIFLNISAVRIHRIAIPKRKYLIETERLVHTPFPQGNVRGYTLTRGHETWKAIISIKVVFNGRESNRAHTNVSTRFIGPSSEEEYLELMVVRNNTPLTNRIPLVLLMGALPFISSMYS